MVEDRMTTSFIIFFALCISAKALSIPDSKRNAYHMLKTGELDSTTWYLIEPFYDQPLSVPDGELNILMDIFPQLPQDLPVSEERLSQYWPWNKKSIDMFFSDWPQLRDFLPILDFSNSSERAIGKAGFFVNNINDNHKASQLGQFSFYPYHTVNFQGRVEITENYARWNSRKIAITPFRWCTLLAGDVNPIRDNGLVMGNFGKSADQDNTILSNWLYGNARKWNVISLQIKPLSDKKAFVITPFIHKRYSEIAAGFTSTVKPVSFFTNEVSCFGIRQYASSDTSYYLMYSAGIKKKFCDLKLVSSVMLGEKTAVPLLIDGCIRPEGQQFRFKLAFIPEAFTGEYSSLLRSISQKKDSSTVHNDIFHAEVSSKHTLLPGLSINPEISSLFNNYKVSKVSAELRVTGDYKKVNYQAGYAYTWNDYNDNYSYNHQFSFYVSVDTLHWMSCEFACNGMVDNKNDLSLHAQFTAEQYVGPILTISPFIGYDNRISKGNYWTAGVAEQMTLFESTSSELSIEHDLTNYKRESIRVKAKMWFLF